MESGDRVYYRHTDQQGVESRLAAIVLANEDTGIRIRTGRYDIHSQQLSLIEAIVPAESLKIRSIPCSYEDELTGKNS